MTVDMYFQYRIERGELDVVQKENGFATYSVNGDEIYLQDIYVKKEYRKTGLATEMADEVCEIGRNLGCKYLIGSVLVGSKGDTDSIKVFLSYGMRLCNLRDNLIILIKDL